MSCMSWSCLVDHDRLPQCLAPTVRSIPAAAAAAWLASATLALDGTAHVAVAPVAGARTDLHIDFLIVFASFVFQWALA